MGSYDRTAFDTFTASIYVENVPDADDEPYAFERVTDEIEDAIDACLAALAERLNERLAPLGRGPVKVKQR